MKNKVLITALVLALAAAVIGGSTMAWFTAKAEVENTFTAGTMLIEADQIIPVDTTEFTNVNPGDAYCVGWEIENVGTKKMELRFDALGEWMFELSGLDDPAHIGICPNYQDDWKIILGEDNNAFGIYYINGPIEPGETVKLVLVVAFDGPDMGNEFQGEIFTLSGMFEAVQASNGAPGAYFGEDWEAGGIPDGYFGDDYQWPECWFQEKLVVDFSFKHMGH